MNDMPLHDSNRRIFAEVLQIQSRCLETLDEPHAGGLNGRIVEILGDTLEAHAGERFRRVKDLESGRKYLEDLRRVGGALILNAEQRSILRDPYSEAKLRRMAESSIEFILRKPSLSPADQERGICKAVDLIREKTMTESDTCRAWKADVVFQIECHFEARYRHWEAKVLDRLDELKASGTVPDANIDGMSTEANESDGASAALGLVSILPASETAPLNDADEIGKEASDGAGQRATSWQGITILFISDERVQIQDGGQTYTLNYTEFGFNDQRSGKPNSAWGELCRLAEKRGIFPPQKGAPVAVTKREKRIQEIRKALRAWFPLPGDPLPLVSGRYQAVFKIGCAPSYDS